MGCGFQKLNRRPDYDIEVADADELLPLILIKDVLDPEELRVMLYGYADLAEIELDPEVFDAAGIADLFITWPVLVGEVSQLMGFDLTPIFHDLMFAHTPQQILAQFCRPGRLFRALRRGNARPERNVLGRRPHPPAAFPHLGDARGIFRGQNHRAARGNPPARIRPNPAAGGRHRLLPRERRSNLCGLRC